MARSKATSWTLRIALLTCAAAFCAAGASLHGPRTSAAATPPPSVAPPDPPVVEVARVALGPVERRVRTQGILEPRRRVAIAAEIHGSVVERGAHELDHVDAEQLLLRIDPLTFRSAVRRAEAEVLRSESALELAGSTLQRRSVLAERGVQSAAALEDAQNAERVARAVLRQARAQLAEARHHLGHTQIRAPFAGFLKQLGVERGEFVREGQVVAEIVDLSVLKLRVGLSDREILGVQVGETLAVRFEDLGFEPSEGTIVRVGQAAAVETRKFPVELELDNATERLLPGMVASVVLEISNHEQAAVIPAAAVRRGERGDFVYALTRSGEPGRGVARRRRVEVSASALAPDMLEVRWGLRAGDEVILSPAPQVADGVPVTAPDPRA